MTNDLYFEFRYDHVFLMTFHSNKSELDRTCLCCNYQCVLCAPICRAWVTDSRPAPEQVALHAPAILLYSFTPQGCDQRNLIAFTINCNKYIQHECNVWIINAFHQQFFFYSFSIYGQVNTANKFCFDHYNVGTLQVGTCNFTIITKFQSFSLTVQEIHHYDNSVQFIWNQQVCIVITNQFRNIQAK